MDLCKDPDTENTEQKIKILHPCNPCNPWLKILRFLWSVRSSNNQIARVKKLEASSLTGPGGHFA